jgi:hypothetical protein
MSQRIHPVDIDRIEQQTDAAFADATIHTCQTITRTCFEKCKDSFYHSEISLFDQNCIKSCVKKFHEAMAKTLDTFKAETEQKNN